MSQDPRIFAKAIRYWGNRTCEKAIRRAKEKNRPMDPWNAYPQTFIINRLNEEIEEWNHAVGPEAELDELKDIVALATSRAMQILHMQGFRLKTKVSMAKPEPEKPRE